jgi:hypothetical protein
MKRTHLLAAAVAAAALSLPSAALLIRPDRDDGEYRELATRYPAALALGERAGAGALIAPRWVLTAAHLAAPLRGARQPLRVDGRAHEVQDVFLHPDWKAGGNADIALVFLRSPVTGVEPAPIYREPDEAGQAVRIVGFGETGRIGGAASERKTDGLPRAAINTVDRVTPRTLEVRLKGPEDASDLQGALAAGDGGSPGFLEAGGRIYVGGIASAPGATGGWETYARVSAFAAWIDDVMSRVAVEEAAREGSARPRRPGT